MKINLLYPKWYQVMFGFEVKSILFLSAMYSLMKDRGISTEFCCYIKERNLR